jgi:DNA-binding NarL/FixJ family response regulator
MARALGYKEPVTHTRVETPAPSASAQPVQEGSEVTPPAAGAEAGTAPPVSPSADRKRVLIADDHEVTRQGIRALLKELTNVTICGEAADGLDATLKARKLNPDLIIMDLSMAGGGGFSAAERIRRSGLRAKILFFTTHQTREIERMARFRGFEGFVQKTEAARDLVRGVQAILQGNCFFGSQILSPEEAKRRSPKSDAARA